MKKIANLTKLIILVTLTNMLISINFAMASDCDWSTIKETNSGYLYSPVCHSEVGNTLANNADYKIEVGSLREAITQKDLTINDLKIKSNMWETEAQNQFSRFEKYREAEKKRTWLYIGGGAAGAFLLMFLANSASK